MNRRNLWERVGGGYAVVDNVPKVYQDVLNERETVRGLGTRDEKEVMRLKPAKLLEIQAEVHRLVNGHHADTCSLMQEAAATMRDRREMSPYGDTLTAYDQQTFDRKGAVAHRAPDVRAHRHS